MILLITLLLSWCLSAVGLIVFYHKGVFDEMSEGEQWALFLACHIACTPIAIMVYLEAVLEKFEK